MAATCGALSITSPVARKPLGASFSQVLKCAGKPLQQYVWRHKDINAQHEDQGCGVGAGVVRSRRFLGGVGVRFLTTLRVGVEFFCPTPTPDVQLDCFFYITLLNWEFLLKWYNFFESFVETDFLLCTTISIDFNR